MGGREEEGGGREEREMEGGEGERGGEKGGREGKRKGREKGGKGGEGSPSTAFSTNRTLHDIDL